ncbi:MAG: histidine phosphatase family protein [Erysipelotrichales bacterium]|nr:histidine phosphatase family protein [Erysipelotrichales bacterium]
MAKVYFVRHAEPNYNNHDDYSRELTTKGLSDRKLVTEYLSDKNISVALSSPYIRSIDTIKHFADSKGLAINIVDDFRERKIDNCWIEDFRGFARKQWEDFTYKLSDGECLKEVQDRNINALKDVVSTYKDKNIIVGSHGTALSTIINYYSPRFKYEQFEEIRSIMPWIVMFEFDGDRCLKIEAYNVFTKEMNVIK